MPIGSTTSTHPTKWELRTKDIKNYFHFDTKHPRKLLETTAQDDDAVTKHAFFPLLLFKEEWIKFRKDGLIRRKIRPLRYCSRLDASIYAYHRYKLSIEYEKILAQDGISDVPIAYRKIPKSSGSGNKCNIDFAFDAFDFIRQCENCDVTIIDVSSFFESLDHDKLKLRWEYVLGRALDDAERAVWRAVTKYSVVDRDAVYERLKMFEKPGGTTRKAQRMRNIDILKAQGKRQLCSPSVFRNLIAGADPNFPSLIQKNTKSVGIPQGTPISDILANIYLIDFDKKLARWARKRQGKYFRYCDDIIVILPRKNGQRHDLAEIQINNIKNDYPELKIQRKKIAVGRFVKVSNSQFYTQIVGAASINGIEYLGFQFDGQTVQIKNSTMSNAWRKLKKRSYGWAKRWVRRYRAKGDAWLLSNAPLDNKVTEVIKSVSIVKVGEYSELTFRKYSERANTIFGTFDTKISNQTKRYKRIAKLQFEMALKKAISIHGYEAFTSQGGRL